MVIEDKIDLRKIHYLKINLMLSKIQLKILKKKFQNQKKQVFQMILWSSQELRVLFWEKV